MKTAECPKWVRAVICHLEALVGSVPLGCRREWLPPKWGEPLALGLGTGQGLGFCDGVLEGWQVPGEHCGGPLGCTLP